MTKNKDFFHLNGTEVRKPDTLTVMITIYTYKRSNFHFIFTTYFVITYVHSM